MARRRKSRLKADNAAPATEIVPWRERFAWLLSAVRERTERDAAHSVQSLLMSRLGGPAERWPHADRLRALDDVAAQPGSAGDGRSIVAACAAELPDLDELERVQLRRWERERSSGVFLIQRAHRDALELWDPLEGAPLMLHLLHRVPEATLRTMSRGSVVPASFQPWVARLVATGETEVFSGSEPVQLFRKETLAGGRTWHDIPAPAPTAKRS